MAKHNLPIAIRLMDNIEMIPESGCWIWMAGRCSHFYGRLKIKGKVENAHRASYREFVGEIPDGLFVCHKCDIPECINPDHLFLGTYADNMEDMRRKGRGRVIAGSGNYHAKLTEHDVLLIRGELDCGTSIAELAERYGVVNSTISMIGTRQRWKHI